MASAATLSAVDDREAGGRSETATAARAAGLLTVASVAGGVINLLFNVVVARSGGIASYGGTGALLAMVTGGGFLAVGVQFAVARRATIRGAESRILLRSVARQAGPWLIAGLVATAAAPAVASFLHLTSALPAVTAVVLIGIGLAAAAPTGILIGQRRFGSVALLMLLPAAVRLLLAAPLTHFHDPILGALIASALPVSAAFVAAVLMALRAPSGHVPAQSPAVLPVDANAERGVVSEGIVGALLATAIWTVWSLPLLFGRHDLRPGDASDLAVAQLVAGGVILVAGAVVTAFFPSIVRGRGVRTVITGLLATITLALTGAVAMVMLVPWLTPRLYGADFATPVALVAALSVSLVAVVVANYLLWVARALQRLLLPTAVGCATAVVVEIGFGALWHRSAATLALGPGLALVAGLGTGGVVALAVLLLRFRGALGASRQQMSDRVADGLSIR